MTSPVVNIYKEPNSHVVPFRDNLSFFLRLFIRREWLQQRVGVFTVPFRLPPRIVGRPLLLLR